MTEPAATLHPITGHPLDEDGHWVAEHACGHQQHVRHAPPWQQLRAWVATEVGRQAHLADQLQCVKCDRGAARDF